MVTPIDTVLDCVFVSLHGGFASEFVRQEIDEQSGPGGRELLHLCLIQTLCSLVRSSPAFTYKEVGQTREGVCVLRETLTNRMTIFMRRLPGTRCHAEKTGDTAETPIHGRDQRT